MRRQKDITFCLIDWYGEGAVPPIEYQSCKALVTVGGTAPSLYQSNEKRAVPRKFCYY